MVDKFYKIHRSPISDFRLAVEDILQGVAQAGAYPIRILFFADVRANEEYLSLKEQMADLCKAFFQEELPLLALVAQSPLRCGLAAEVTYIAKENVSELKRYDDYITLGDEVLSYAVVDALEVSAENDDSLIHRHAVGHFLVPLLAIGRGVDDFIIVALALELGDEVVDRLNLHYHTGTTSKGVVICAAMLVGSVVSYVMDDDIGQSILLGAGHDGTVEESFNHFGQYGEYVNSHRAICLEFSVFCLGVK